MWMLLKQDPKGRGRTDIFDLDDDPILMWQHKNYGLVILCFETLFSMVVAGLSWGDWKGGLIYVYMRPSWPLDGRHSPRDHVLTALVMLGEGYHNFHHEFRPDYRNAKVGLAYNPKHFRANKIGKGSSSAAQKKVDQKRTQLDWGIAIEQLPVMSWDGFLAESHAGKALVTIAGVVHDLSGFMGERPGRKTLISSATGKDVAALFNGDVYDHSNAAYNLLSSMRDGIIRGGGEVGIWQEKDAEKLKTTE
ncbi:hypothetical protein N7468_007592 [Penicillium chermesinum]|uniref:Cytochrome b5 heme-binding domain-containing protein n=1 Tax=Penicillium chermesinum TaxID=63820 RepID=A0A9W9TKM2_9EURO|nr:uncharacterized protein N7468_007592 [Penicillium chermesinum]KAJ5226367.1 hypothetical protein N7468_007592 [Penicillium chermesinum]KAJ6160445.1 hypothetical protein N7470_003841 [Penicillium chermesinum]